MIVASFHWVASPRNVASPCPPFHHLFLYWQEEAAAAQASNKLAESIGVNLFNAAISIIHESDEDEGDKDNSDDAYSCHQPLSSGEEHIRKAQVLQNTLQEAIQRFMELVVDTFSWPFH